MPTPEEHKIAQARILHYAQEIRWNCVFREEAEARRGFDPDSATPEDRVREFGDSLSPKLRQAVAEMETTS
jgi:hypothetical protein